MLHDPLKELAYREQADVAVTLLWNAASGGVSVELFDRSDGTKAFVPVPGSCALDAFQHPYLYVSPADALVRS
jgi:hypothetical protein